jgi:hypothetical protein
MSLNETTLFTTPIDKAALLADKTRIAHAFLFNFVGLLGLINATKPYQKKAILDFIKRDKKIRLDTITDENHDISLVVKLVNDQGWFINTTTPAEITRFLFKLKSGQVTDIDSTIVAKWLSALKPEFYMSIKDQLMKTETIAFKQDGGVNIDISHLAIIYKKRANKIPDAGEFQLFSKKFAGLERRIGAASVPSNVTVAAAPAVGPVPQPVQVTPTPVQPPAPPVDPAEATIDKFLATANEKIQKLDPNYKIVRRGFRQADLVGPGGSILTSVTFPGVYEAEGLFQQLISSVDRIVNPPPAGMTEKEFYEDLDSILRGRPRTSKSGSSIEERVLSVIEMIMAPGSDLPINDMIKIISNLYDLVKELPFKFSIADFLVSRVRYRAKPQVFRDMLGAFSHVNYDHADLKAVLKGIPSYNILEDLSKTTLAFKKDLAMYAVSSDSSSNMLAAARCYLEPGGIDMDHFSGFFIAAWLKANPTEPLTDKISTAILAYTIPEYEKLVSSTPDLYGLTQAAENYVNQKTSLNDKEARDLASVIRLAEVEIFTKNSAVRNKISELIKERILAKDRGSLEYSIYNFYNPAVLNFLGLDYDFFIKRDPDDRAIIRAKYNHTPVKDISVDDLLKTINIYNVQDLSTMMRKGTQEEIADKCVDVMTELLRTDHQRMVISFIPSLFAVADKDSVVKFMTVAMEKKNPRIFGTDHYKNLKKHALKDQFANIMASIMNDCIGTKAEDYVNELLEQLPGTVLNKIRRSIVGISTVKEEIVNGAIKPFADLTPDRLKQIFNYNEIKLDELISDEIPRKSKKETYTQYIQRVKAEKKKSTSKILPELKITADTTNLREKNLQMIRDHYAGNHGGVVPRLIKSFKTQIEFPEFYDFAQLKPLDGKVIPAYHGTGGIAATMIIRYGFKVIKSTDPSVVGRMLGDGIYFSNKIDKATQYVSNGGYGRRDGEQGYIFELDVNLGTDGQDYRAAGLGPSSNIKSPEWCVYDPKKQIRIVTAYEVVLTKKDKLMAELTEGQQMRGFKSFLNESSVSPAQPQASFTFRDGIIPIVKDEEGNIEYLDFEEAIQKKKLNPMYVEYTGLGPSIVFPHTEDYFSDSAYHDQFIGESLQTYIDLYTKYMR